MPDLSPEPCEAFHWIGQPMTSCDRCGKPAWEHKGRAVLPENSGPFTPDTWELKPWEPGQAEAIKRKWDR